VYEKADDSLIPLVVDLAVFREEDVTSFWVDTALFQCISSQNERVIYACSVLTALMSCRHISAGAAFHRMVYCAIRMRLVFGQDVLFACKDFIAMLFRVLIRTSDLSVDADFRLTSAAFWSTAALDDFVSGRAKRPWIVLTAVLATTFRACIPDGPLADFLYARFVEEAASTDIAPSCSSLVMAGTFAPRAAPAFLDLAIGLLRTQKDERVIGALCLGLAALRLPSDEAARLFVAGFALTLLLVGPPAIVLVGATFRAAVEQLEAGKTVPGLAALSPKVGIDIAAEPLFATLVLVCCCGDVEDEETIVCLARGATGPLGAVLSLLDRGTPPRTLDFGRHAPSIAVLLLRLVTVFPRPEIIAYATVMLERRPSLVAGLPVMQGPFAATLMEAAPDPALFSALALAAAEPDGDLTVIPLVRQLLTDNAPNSFSAAEFDCLFAALYPS
jgi:hypothetical protein